MQSKTSVGSRSWTKSSGESFTRSSAPGSAPSSSLPAVVVPTTSTIHKKNSKTNTSSTIDTNISLRSSSSQIGIIESKPGTRDIHFPTSQLSNNQSGTFVKSKLLGSLAKTIDEPISTLATERWSTVKLGQTLEKGINDYYSKQLKYAAHVRNTSNRKAVDLFEKLLHIMRWANPPIVAGHQTVIVDYCKHLLSDNPAAEYPDFNLLEAFYENSVGDKCEKVVRDLRKLYHGIRDVVLTRDSKLAQAKVETKIEVDRLTVRREGQLRWKMEHHTHGARNTFWTIWYLTSQHDLNTELERYLSNPEHHGEVNLRDPDHGLTPLHYACRRGDRRAFDLLLNLKADIHCCAPDGRTPLHFAAMYGTKEIALELLALGVDYHAKDSFGCLALDLANQNKNLPTFKALSNWFSLVPPLSTDSHEDSQHSIPKAFDPIDAPVGGLQMDIDSENLATIPDEYLATPEDVIDRMPRILRVHTRRLCPLGPHGFGYVKDPFLEMRLCEKLATLCFQEGFRYDGFKSLRRRWRVARIILTLSEEELQLMKAEQAKGESTNRTSKSAPSESVEGTAFGFLDAPSSILSDPTSNAGLGFEGSIGDVRLGGILEEGDSVISALQQTFDDRGSGQSLPNGFGGSMSAVELQIPPQESMAFTSNDNGPSSGPEQLQLTTITAETDRVVDNNNNSGTIVSEGVSVGSTSEVSGERTSARPAPTIADTHQPSPAIVSADSQSWERPLDLEQLLAQANQTPPPKESNPLGPDRPAISMLALASLTFEERLAAVTHPAYIPDTHINVQRQQNVPSTLIAIDNRRESAGRPAFDACAALDVGFDLAERCLVDRQEGYAVKVLEECVTVANTLPECSLKVAIFARLAEVLVFLFDYVDYDLMGKLPEYWQPRLQLTPKSREEFEVVRGGKYMQWTAVLPADTDMDTISTAPTVTTSTHPSLPVVRGGGGGTHTQRSTTSHARKINSALIGSDLAWEAGCEPFAATLKETIDENTGARSISALDVEEYRLKLLFRARVMIEQALEIHQNIYRADVIEPATLGALLEIQSDVYERGGDNARAYDIMRHVEAVYKRALGPQHADTERVGLQVMRINMKCTSVEGFKLVALKVRELGKPRFRHEQRRASAAL